MAFVMGFGCFFVNLFDCARALFIMNDVVPCGRHFMYIHQTLKFVEEFFEFCICISNYMGVYVTIARVSAKIDDQSHHFVPLFC